MIIRDILNKHKIYTESLELDLLLYFEKLRAEFKVAKYITPPVEADAKKCQCCGKIKKRQGFEYLCLYCGNTRTA